DRPQGQTTGVRDRVAVRRRLRRRGDARLPDRGENAVFGPFEGQRPAARVGGPLFATAGGTAAEGRLRDGGGVGHVSGRIVALPAARGPGDCRLPRSENGSIVPRTRLFLSGHELYGRTARGGGAAGALSAAGHVRGPAGRVPPMDRAETFLAGVRRERRHLAVVTIGVQPGEHAALRTGRRGGGLLGPGTVSKVGAQGWRADRQEGRPPDRPFGRRRGAVLGAVGGAAGAVAIAETVPPSASAGLPTIHPAPKTCFPHEGHP